MAVRATELFFPHILQGAAMGSLADCQKWTVSAFPICMSISHPQPAIVDKLELLGSHEIDMLSRGHIEGYGRAGWTVVLFLFQEM